MYQANCICKTANSTAIEALCNLQPGAATTSKKLYQYNLLLADFSLHKWIEEAGTECSLLSQPVVPVFMYTVSDRNESLAPGWRDKLTLKSSIWICWHPSSRPSNKPFAVTITSESLQLSIESYHKQDTRKEAETLRWNQTTRDIKYEPSQGARAHMVSKIRLLLTFCQLRYFQLLKNTLQLVSV